MRKFLDSLTIALAVIFGACGDITGPASNDAPKFAVPTASANMFTSPPAARSVREVWPIVWSSLCTGLTYTGDVVVHREFRQVLRADNTSYWQEHLNFVGGALKDQNGRTYRIQRNTATQNSVPAPNISSLSANDRYQIVPTGAGARGIENLVLVWSFTTVNGTVIAQSFYVAWNC